MALPPSPQERTAVALTYKLRGLPMAGAVLHMGAHPDDEESGLLSYLAHKHGMRVVYWSATRGESGQNRLNAYAGEALGVYRTWESQDARAIDGAECLFGPFIDFGYSKNAAETLNKWGKDALLREMVRAIRLVQPDVVIARWSGSSDDEHGHHQAFGLVASDAFEAAGDPEQFPELRVQGLASWQPLKLYRSTMGDFQPGQAGIVFGSRDPELESDGFVCINTGELDPVAGTTYQEQAWAAINSYRSQGLGLAPAPGDFFYYIRMLSSRVAIPAREESVFDGFDPTLVGLADRFEWRSGSGRNALEAICDAARTAFERFRPSEPASAVTPLLECISLTRRLLGEAAVASMAEEARRAFSQYLERKIADLEETIAACLGVRLECLSDRAQTIPGRKIRVTGRLFATANVSIERPFFSLWAPDGWTIRPEEAAADRDGLEGGLVAGFEVSIPETADLSCPYWLETESGPNYYSWPDGEPAGRPFGPPSLLLECRVLVAGRELTLRAPALRREAFPGGWRALPVSVIPPISLHPATRRVFLQARTSGERWDPRTKQDVSAVLDFLEESLSDHRMKLSVVARNNSDGPARGRLILEAPPGWEVEPPEVQLVLTEPEESISASFTVGVSANVAEGQYVLRYRIRHEGRDYSMVLNPVRMAAPGMLAPPDGTNCVKEEFLLEPSRVLVHVIDAAFAKELRCAYIKGAKEEVPEILQEYGVAFHLLTDEELKHADLTQFDVIVVGPNAYLVRDELRRNAGRVLEFVSGGGTLIVQYQAYGYDAPGLAPYPFQFSQPHDRVTDETAPVTILEPNHVLFRVPNVIGPADFDGWVKDRGLYFFGTWDKRYRPLMACADHGEGQRAGGLVECQFGRGTYVYTGYSLFKQVPAGVPGPLRLFANLLSLPLARQRERVEFLGGVSWLSTLNPEDLGAVAGAMTEVLVEDGDEIRMPSGRQHLMVLYRGSVEITDESDEPDVTEVAGPGAVFGGLGSSPTSANGLRMRAVGATHLLSLSRAQLHELIRRQPDISMKVIDFLSQRPNQVEKPASGSPNA